jgi:ATP-dependent Clp protease ATP-binding subunit ClpA
MERVRKHFAPEFLNRIDEFICFEPLRWVVWVRVDCCVVVSGGGGLR